MTHERDVSIEQASTVVATLARGGTARDALTAAGFSKNAPIAPVLGSRNVQRGLTLLREALERIGVDDAALARTIAEGLQAIQVVVARSEGKISHVQEFVDHATRLKFCELAIQVREGLRRVWSPENQRGRMILIDAKYAKIFLGADEKVEEEQPAPGANEPQGGSEVLP